jgi:PTS system cellobiose-specific IIC component
MMEKLQKAMEKTLIPVANRLSSSKVLRAISSGFSMLLPVIMVGAIASLLAGLSIAPYQSFITAIGLKPLIGMVATYTTNMIALYAVFAIGKSMADQLACKDQSVLVGLVTLFMFLLQIPTGIGEGDAAVASAISTTYFGAAGLFTAMILGVTVPLIYNVFITRHIVIKMPDGVPPQIANGFSAILPAGFLTILFVIVRQLCTLTSFGTLNDLIYGILRTPLSTLTQSPWTFALLVLLCNLLWFFGIHGGMVVMPFISMLYMAPAIENLDALAAGASMPNLLTNTWWFTFVQLGGSGGVIGLAICMFFFAKSDRYKTLGKICILPAMCSISEPIVFGFPLVLNVLLFIPMIITPLLSFGLSYLLTVLGVLPYLNGLQLSVGTPVLLSGFLTGGWRAAVWQVVLVAMQFAIYFPFFKICDKQAVAEEKETA